MRVLVLLIALFCSNINVKAQGKMMNIEVGDTLTFGKCQNKPNGFVAIDLMNRTRWQEKSKPYDKATGEGFYDSYFTGADFDTKRLPCHYEGVKVKIVSIHQFPNDDRKSIRTIFFAQTGKNVNELFWIEIEKAASNGELVF